ncbi:MAG: hypothetical protein U0840_21670 [Gemmataceae bacterium]
MTEEVCKWVSLRRAARRFGLHHDTLSKLVTRGLLQRLKVPGGRKVLVHLDEVEAVLRGNVPTELVKK